MVVAARPDIIGAVIARLLSFTELTAVVGTRISPQYKPDWTNPQTNKPRKSVLVRPAGGPVGKRHLNIMQSRIQLHCYGTNGHECERTWAIADACFCPGQETQGSYIITVNGVKCRVYTVAPEGMPIPSQEPQTDWPVLIAPYIITWCGVAAS